MSQSVYQLEGRPLSQTAVHQQRLRKGQFTSPSYPSVGVNSNASDTAALLAASSDLHVKPSYERQVASEAWSAALAAKPEDIHAWKRGSVGKMAESAASSIRASSMSSSVTSGTAVYTGIPNYSGSSVYQVANKRASATMTSRISPEKDSRHGLAAKSAAATLNMAKVSSLATKNSSKSLNGRMNPNPDYRSGLIDNDVPLSAEEETLADQSASAALSSGSRSRSRSFKSSELPYPALMAAANSKAQERLGTLSSTGTDFKAKAIEFADALTIAQKRSEERMQQHSKGLIDLGGGLSITPEELSSKVSMIVSPVLQDIDAKVSAQIVADTAAAEKKRELKEQHQRAKILDYQNKQKEKQEILDEKKARVLANEKKMQDHSDKLVIYKNGREEEVKYKLAELEDLKGKYASEKEELLKLKDANQKEIDAEEAELIAKREEELKTMQQEKDEIIKPTLEELEVETTKLNELENSKTELETEVEKLETINKEYNDKVTELNESLSAIKEEIEKYSTELKEFEKEDVQLTTDLENLRESSKKEQAEIEESEKELDNKLKHLEEEKAKKLKEKEDGKAEIKAGIEQTVKDQYSVQKELPDHLRSDVREENLRDTGSLFTIEKKPTIQSNHSEKIPGAKFDKKSDLTSNLAEQRNGSSASKKNSGFRRFTKYFSTESKPSKQYTTGQSKGNQEISEPTANVTKDPLTNTVSHKGSVASGLDIDDASLNKNKNQGGIFQEEI